MPEAMDQKRLDAILRQLRTAYGLLGKVLERDLVPDTQFRELSAEELRVVGLPTHNLALVGRVAVSTVVSTINSLVDELSPYVVQRSTEGNIELLEPPWSSPTPPTSSEIADLLGDLDIAYAHPVGRRVLATKISGQVQRWIADLDEMEFAPEPVALGEGQGVEFHFNGQQELTAVLVDGTPQRIGGRRSIAVELVRVLSKAPDRRMTKRDLNKALGGEENTRWSDGTKQLKEWLGRDVAERIVQNDKEYVWLTKQVVVRGVPQVP